MWVDGASHARVAQAFAGHKPASVTDGYTKPTKAELVDVLARLTGTKNQWAKNVGEMRLQECTFTVKCRKTFLLEKWESNALLTGGGTLCAMDTNDYEAVPVGPFTDFGQFGEGRIDLRVFLQSEYWVDGNGIGHCLTSMSDEYRGNVVRVLLISAEKLHIKILYLIVKMLRHATLARDTD
jgi:hypothetical protein